MGSEPVVKREWKAGPGYVECSGNIKPTVKKWS